VEEEGADWEERGTLRTQLLVKKTELENAKENWRTF